MAHAKALPTLMVSSLKLTHMGSPPVDDATLYRSVVGTLQYATIAHPDISFTVNKVCQFMYFPLEKHWKVVKCILCYLISRTMHHGLVLSHSKFLHLAAFCDADWANDMHDCRSTSGSCIYLADNLILWFFFLIGKEL